MAMQRRDLLLGAALAAGAAALRPEGLLAQDASTPAQPLAAPRFRNAWDNYAGPEGRFADRSGVRLMEDLSQIRVAWTGEDNRIGYGKTTTRGVPADFGDIPPGGCASPIVANGLALQAYFLPSGDVVDALAWRAEGREAATLRQRYLVGADDIVLAVDAATGRNRWKRVFEGLGVSVPMGKRTGWGITPAASEGRVFAVGTTGRVFALDLDSGNVLWQSDVGARHRQLEEAKRQALRNGRAVSRDMGFRSVWGMVVVVDGVAVVPDLDRGLIGFDVRTGRKRWELSHDGGITSGWNTPAPMMVGGRRHLVAVNATGDLRLIHPENGNVLWTHPLGSHHLTHPVPGEELLFVFDPVATDDVPMLAPGRQQDRSGCLAGYRLTERGAARVWAAPHALRRELNLDGGPCRCAAIRDGRIYLHQSCRVNMAEGQARNRPAGEMVHDLHILREGDGRVLHTARDVPFRQFHLWGDKFIAVSDVHHRPSRWRPELWQMYPLGPDNFRPLGEPWQLNSRMGHYPCGGYEVPLFDVFADGYLICRALGYLKAYDLRPMA